MKKNKTPITIKKLLSLTCDSLEDDKAIDIKTIDLKDRSSIADFMVCLLYTSPSPRDTA